MSKITIFLADDHNLVRQGLRSLLERENDFTVIGEAADGIESLRLVERLQPRVLVQDLAIPGMNGLLVARQLQRRSPATRVVILSMHAQESYVLEALRNGAAGYVLKDSVADDLIKAIREVAAGRRFLSPPFADLAIGSYLKQAPPATRDAYNTLTDREREVLQLAAEGHNNPQIGERLFISPRTVEIHRGNMMHKLKLHNQTELIRYALERGILSQLPPLAVGSWQNSRKDHA